MYCALRQKKSICSDGAISKTALGKLPVNIKGGSWRIGAQSEGLWRNVTYVPSHCQILHEQFLAHAFLPLD